MAELENYILTQKGPSIKDVCTLGGGGRGGGQAKVDRRGQGEGGWLAKCGHPLGKKIIATIFVRFTQINEIFSFSR